MGKITPRGWGYITVLLVTGTAGALLYKAMCQVTVVIDGVSGPYDHAYLQTLFMYVGQFLDVVIIAVDVALKRRKRRRPSQSNIQAYSETEPLQDPEENVVPDADQSKKLGVSGAMLLFGPTCVDVLGSTLYNLGVKYALVSVCQMVRNCSVLFVAAFSAVCFKSYRVQFDFPQALGLGLLCAGMAGICVTSYYRDGGQTSAPNNGLGIVLVITGSVFSAGVYVMEEGVFKKLPQTEGMEVVAAEGLWGGLLYIPLIFILNASMKISDTGTIIRAEDIQLFSAQMANSGALVAFLVLYILSITFYSFASLQTTKHASAVVRSMFDAAKTLAVWALSLAFGWEKVDAIGTPLKLLAYVAVVCGTLVYNGLVPWIPNLRKANRSGFQYMVEPDAGEWSFIPQETGQTSCREAWE